MNMIGSQFSLSGPPPYSLSVCWDQANGNEQAKPAVKVAVHGGMSVIDSVFLPTRAFRIVVTFV